MAIPSAPAAGPIAGTGVGWRPALAGLLEEQAAEGRLGFTEVIAENTRPDDLPTAVLALRDRGVPVVPHGVTLGLAGAERPDPRRLERLASLAEVMGSPVVSEHLMPPPRTRAALDVLVDNVRIAQDAVGVPLALENIAALLTWPEDEYDEPDFLSELVARTGCRLVLDVANLFASATARRTDAAEELARFPLEAVAYVHVAGGQWEDGLYLDTHGHPMLDPVLDLAARLGDLYGDRPLPGVMLERDTDASEATVRPELDRLQRAVSRVPA